VTHITAWDKSTRATTNDSGIGKAVEEAQYINIHLIEGKRKAAEYVVSTSYC